MLRNLLMAAMIVAALGAVTLGLTPAGGRLSLDAPAGEVAVFRRPWPENGIQRAIRRQLLGIREIYLVRALKLPSPRVHAAQSEVARIFEEHVGALKREVEMIYDEKAIGTRRPPSQSRGRETLRTPTPFLWLLRETPQQAVALRKAEAMRVWPRSREAHDRLAAVLRRVLSPSQRREYDRFLASVIREMEAVVAPSAP